MKRFLNRIKSEKGFTLVELLAVIVILGIIAAIAVPSIGGIISNTKQDAHESNEIMFEEAARLAFASGENFDENSNDGDENDSYTLKFLKDKGYLETIPPYPQDDTEEYNPDSSYVTVDYSKDGSDNHTASYTVETDTRDISADPEG
ncbi:competence type IV pilus major pilin ComGC [Aquibacillus sediminis]|uniref:competence type IV pilus major pilin ComGC n=1 Tax=Aquibacillus sediminis TaxID=2574734 RepID=UPI001109195F|nr:type II secretion system protein [Aquibacillus sediminis]